MTATPNTNGNGFPHTVREAAGIYLSRFECQPIPVAYRAKAPVRADWNSLRPTPEDLDALFPSDRQLNIGVHLGLASNKLTDVDLDCPQAVTVADLLLPVTGWVFGRPGTPRSHRLYRPDYSMDSETFEDLDGRMLMELRSDNVQTVFPPSIHTTGELIGWESFTKPAEVDIGHFRRVVRATAAATLLARHWPEKGSRQKAAMALAGGLARAGASEDGTRRFIEAVATAAGDDEVRMRLGVVEGTYRKAAGAENLRGWPSLAKLLGTRGNEIVERARAWLGIKTEKLSEKNKAKSIRRIAPAQPFPVELLPSPVREFVHEGALSLRCDPTFFALPCLAVVASLIGNTRVIRLKRDWDEPCVVWAFSVAKSGTLKSPAYRKVVRHLFRLQKKLLGEFKAATERYHQEMAAYKARNKERSKKRPPKEEAEHDATPDTPPEKPVFHRLVCSDITIEKVAEILEDNPRGVLMARDEGAGWLGSFSRYKAKQGASDLPYWLEAFQAGPWMVDRKTGPRTHYYVEHAAVSVVGGIQPGVLARALTGEFMDAGGAARLLMALPTPPPKRWTEAEIDPDTEQAYHAILDRLAALTFEQDDSFEEQPYVLKLSPDAKRAWVAFYDSWADEQAAVEGELAAAFSKLEAYAARLALIHHVVTHVGLDVDDRREVGVKSIEVGVTLCRWFAHEARRIYSALTESEEEKETRALVEFIRTRGGIITVKQLQRSNSKKYPRSEDAEQALQALVDAELACWQERPTTAAGGRPTRNCCLFPETPSDETDETDETPPEGGPDGGGVPTDGPTIPTSFSDDTPKNSDKTEVSSVSSVSSVESQGFENKSPVGLDHWGVSSDSLGVSSDAGILRNGHPPADGTTELVTQTPLFTLISSQGGLLAVANALEESVHVGLDLETTGLDPRRDRIRLLSLQTDRGLWVVDCFQVDPRPLFDLLEERTLIAHNAVFDLSFLAALDFQPGAVKDTMLLSQLLYGTRQVRGFHGLAGCVQRELGRTVEKEQQKSDWSRPHLSAEQLAYAALDADVLVPLAQALDAKIQAGGLSAVAGIENSCLPAMVWLSRSGVPFDSATWQGLATSAEAEANELARQLDSQATAPPQRDLLGGGWNWDSPDQVRQALQDAGCKLESTADEALAALGHPLAELVRKYREAKKKVTTYGTDWLSHVADDGRVYAGWRQLGADSGRMACRSPNMQQLPRGEYRRCVKAPEGRVLVKADYSQIELRIAAKVSGDAAMLAAYRDGQDLHTLTARQLLGKVGVTKADRQIAKSANFGLLYGMGSRGYRIYARTQYGLDLTDAQADRYRRVFFTGYPGLARWHQQVRLAHAAETRTLAGRRRLMDAKTPDTQRLNTPVQGTGADGLKRALALLWERRGQVPGAFPVLVVHDEIVVECDAGRADAASDWLKQAMMDGMAPLIDPVPVEVEIMVAPTWGGE